MNLLSLASLYRFLDKSEEILNELRELYLRDSRVWLCMISMGKDSTTMADHVYRMLERLPKEQRIKKVHFITSDTLCEVPQMLNHVKRNVIQMQQDAKDKDLPIEVHLAEPELDSRFFYQVLGKGNPPPNERSRFRWCSEKLKIDPTDHLVEKIISEQVVLDEFDAVMLLGVRIEESSNRAASIKKHEIDDSKFARNVKFPRVLVYHPIKYWDQDDVWGYLLQQNYTAWGADSNELLSLYNNASGECAITSTDGKQSTSCGGSRFGCWTCCYNGRRDKMLINLYDSGERNIRHLLQWKLNLYDMRNDARFRLPLRRQIQNNLDVLETEYFNLDEDFEGEWQYQPGPLTIYARMLLLQWLLYAAEQTGYELICEEEIQAILACWEDEGVVVVRGELRPERIPVLDCLSLRTNGTLNTKDSDYRGKYEEQFIDVRYEDIMEFSTALNKLFSGRIWVLSKDQRRAKEIVVDSDLPFRYPLY